MNAISINSVSGFAGFTWLTGPIFDKELRVSSRRQRNYVLRSVYLALLTVFVVVVWLQSVQYVGSSGLFISSRLAAAGKEIVVTIIWFQFCATQALAVIMLSTAIGDEIYLGTLGVLMTTPITSFQIVMGKLFSKLLQLILLLAISLPLLAIVRVFGGVPWNYVISSLCITFTTIIFFGSVSLFFSIISRRAYVVIILTSLVLAFLFGFLLFLYMLIFSVFPWGLPWSRQADASITIVFHLNPYMMLALDTDVMLNPVLAGRVSSSWPVHCGIMLAASSVVLSVSVYLVRKIALAQASGYPNILRRLLNPTGNRSVKGADSSQPDRQIRRVKGSPIVWKELKSRVSSRERFVVAVIIGLELVLIAAMYLFPIVVDVLDPQRAYMLYLCIFIGLGLLTVTIFPATSITSEKEARTWSLLLLTPLSGWEILAGKFVGVLRRSSFVWLLPFVYIGLFWLFEYVGVGLLAIVKMAVIVAGSVVFLCGTGFYFSSLFRRTSAAVIANFLLAVIIWGVLPYLVELLINTFHPVGYAQEMIGKYFFCAVPFVQAMFIMTDRMDLSESFRFMPMYILIGFLFAWRAKCRLRRNIF